MTGADDRELVERTLSGDESAFEALLDRYESRIFSFSWRMCGQKQDAEDAVQDVFFDALRALGSFRWEVPLLSWLFRIAANRCRRMRRLRVGQPRHLDSLDAAPMDRTSAAGDDPLEAVLKDERARRIQAAVLKLPKDLRMVLLLRDFEDQNTAETAAILGVREGAVKTRLHRARMKLKELLGGPDGKTD